MHQFPITVSQDFTKDISKLADQLISIDPRGDTAMYDAVYLGLEKLKNGQYPRKALLLITDGENNHSHYSERNVKEVLKEQDVQIYAIGIGADIRGEAYFDPLFGVVGPAQLGWNNIEELTKASGGQAFFPQDVDELPNIYRQIANQLKHEYVLGYRSTNPVKDGKWRKIHLKLRAPKGQNRLAVRFKSGYYALEH